MTVETYVYKMIQNDVMDDAIRNGIVSDVVAEYGDIEINAIADLTALDDAIEIAGTRRGYAWVA